MTFSARHPSPCAHHRVLRPVLLWVLITFWLSACSSLPTATSRVPSTALDASPQLPLAQWLAGQRVGAVPPGSSGMAERSGFQLLETFESAYRSRLALIDNAHQTLDLQYYAIHYDPSTALLLDRLRQAAQRGVRVRLLLDDFHAVGDDARVLQLDQEPGIEVRMFNPVAGPRGSQAGRVLGSLFDFQRIQQRMHNKTLLADSTLAIAGGRNLGDAYFGRSDTSNFLDLDVLAGGPLVAALARSFDRYWNDTRAYPVQDLLTAHERAALATTPDTPPAAAAAEQAARVPFPAPLPTGAVLTWAPAVLLVDKPTKIAPENPQDEADGEHNVVEGVLQVLATARQDVLIVSPYFVPGPRMMETFSALRRQGVRVRVLTNSLASNDAPLAHVGYARWRKQLLQLGVELFEMPAQGHIQRRLLGSRPDARASLHAKALVLDQRLLVVGSMNLDPRSALQNTELGIVIRSRSLSRAMTQTLERGLAGSYRVQLHEGHLRWLPPADAENPTAQAAAPLHSEPDASRALQLLLLLASPFAPDELL